MNKGGKKGKNEAHWVHQQVLSPTYLALAAVQYGEAAAASIKHFAFGVR